MIIQDGLRRMVAEQEDVFYYLTLMNENYQHPAMPEGAEEGILRGMYLLREAAPPAAPRSRACSCSGSGTILREVLAAAELLESDFGVARRRVERDLVHRAAPRRDRGRALEHAAPDARSRAPPT